jgi:hypothetical protein
MMKKHTLSSTVRKIHVFFAGNSNTKKILSKPERKWKSSSARNRWIREE